MTLAEMVSLVTDKVNMVETEDQAACRKFLQRWHETMWNAQLWKDSLVEYVQELDFDYTAANNWLPTAGVLLLPPIIQRPLAVRSDTRHFNVQRPEFYYRRDWDSFAKTGAPVEFILQSPVVWQLDGDYYLRFSSDDGGDVNGNLTLDTLDTDGVGVTRTARAYSLSNFILDATSRLDAALKNASSGTFSVYADVSSLSSPGLSIVVRNQSSSALQVKVNTVNDINTASSFTVSANSESGIALQAYLWVYNASTATYGSVQTIPGGTAFNGTINWDGTEITLLPDVVIASLAPTVTQATKRQRIRLVPIPEDGDPITIRVLGKRYVPNFTDDNDSPAIVGSELCLLRFAEAYMWERARQFGFAASVKAEAGQLLQDLIQQETVQQAHQVTIVPDSGYRPDWDLYSANPLTF